MIGLARVPRPRKSSDPLTNRQEYLLREDLTRALRGCPPRQEGRSSNFRSLSFLRPVHRPPPFGLEGICSSDASAQMAIGENPILLGHCPITLAPERAPPGTDRQRVSPDGLPEKEKNRPRTGRTLSAGAPNLFAAYRGGRWCMSARLDEPSLDPPNVVFRVVHTASKRADPRSSKRNRRGMALSRRERPASTASRKLNPQAQSRRDGSLPPTTETVIATLVGQRAQLIEFPDCLDGGANRLLAELVDPMAYVRVDLSRAALQRSTGPSAGLDQQRRR